MSTPQPSDLEFRLLPESPDSRLFIALISCKRDLEEAATSLEYVLTDSDDERIEWVRQGLLEHATFAYRRADDPQKLPKRLSALVTIPEEFALIDAVVRGYRNKVAAHSQSELVSTFAVVALDHGRPVPGAFGLTVTSAIPLEVLRKWDDQIEHLLTLLDEELRAVRLRIDEMIANTAPMDIAAWEPYLDVAHRLASDFDATVHRSDYPISVPVYWSLLAED